MATIISEAEYSNAVQTLSNAAKALMGIVDRYEACVQDTGSQTEDTKQIRAALSEHLAQATAAMRQIATSLQPLPGQVQEFLERIDEIDDFVY